MNPLTSLIKNTGRKIASYLPEDVILIENAHRKGHSLTDSIVPYHLQKQFDYTLKDWKQAVITAQRVDYPNRSRLYGVYENIMIDNHLASIIETRILKVMAEDFVLVDEATGEIDQERTQLIKRPWFEQFVRYTMEAIFWGHSLIEMMDMDENGELREITLVPRRHVIPDRNLVVKYEMDTSGWDYMAGKNQPWYMPVGYEEELGVLYKAAPVALAKKFALGAYSEYVEKFGIPYRYVKTPIKDKKRHEMLGNILSKMGQAGWGVFYNEEEINSMDNNAQTGNQVFEKFIERMNSELSKIVLGSTGTVDMGGEGGTYAQSKVHYEMNLPRFQADKDFVKNQFNYNALPRLIQLGYQFEGLRGQWNEGSELTLKDHIEVINNLNQHYKVDPDYVTEQTGIPVEEQDNPAPMPGGTTGHSGKKKSNDIVLSLPSYPDGCCDQTDIPAITDQNRESIEEKLLDQVWNGESKFDRDYFEWLSEQYTKGVTEGFEERMSDISLNAEDHLTRSMMEANVQQFSAAKSLAAVNQLNQMVAESSNFNDFKKQAESILDDYNRNWLKTEYNNAVGMAESAANAHRLDQTADVFPYWKYVTAGDNRVRQSHARLDGSLFNKDDGQARRLMPKNDWGCRCIAEDSEGPDDNERPLGGEEGIEKLKQVKQGRQTEWEKMQRDGFDRNPADTKQSFSWDTYYITDPSKMDSKLTRETNGLPVMSDVDTSNLPELPKQNQQQATALNWFEEQVGKNELNDDNRIRLLDRNQRPVHINRDRFEELTDTSKNALKDRPALAPKIPEAISDPDEVMFISLKENVYEYSYLKYYNEEMMKVGVRLNKDDSEVTSFYRISNDEQADAERNGVLTFRKQ